MKAARGAAIVDGSEQRDDQYATAAAAYDDLDRLPLRRFAEVPTLLAELGPVNGLDVLDLACGTGFYSRLLLANGARSVTGGDPLGGYAGPRPGA